MNYKLLIGLMFIMILFPLSSALREVVPSSLAGWEAVVIDENFQPGMSFSLPTNVTLTLASMSETNGLAAENVSIYLNGTNSTLIQSVLLDGNRNGTFSLALTANTNYWVVLTSNHAGNIQHYVNNSVSAYPINWTTTTGANWLYSGYIQKNGTYTNIGLPTTWRDVVSLTYQYNNLSFGTTASYNTSVYETDQQIYALNISTSSINVSSAILYLGTVNKGSANIISTPTYQYINKSTIIPIGNGSTYWHYSLVYSDGSVLNSTLNYYNVSSLNLTVCTSAPLNVPYINVSFKNETIGLENIAASISSTWNYYLGDGSIYKTLSFANTSTNNAYAFCASPSNRTLNVNTSITYYNPDSLQRSWISDTLQLNNSGYNKTLYLLPNSLGQAVTFQIVNSAGEPIESALVTVSSSSLGTLESKYSDGAGGATFFLNPLTTYTITAFKSGFDTVSVSITPSQTSYTITLGGTTNVTQSDYTKGVITTIRPRIGTDLVNGTTYPFNFTISSTFWSLDSFGFVITNGTATTILGSNSSTSASGGILNNQIHTGNNTIIVMNYYWVINNTYNNASVQWYVSGSLDQWSLAALFTDASRYAQEGIFGLTPNSMYILVFVIIFVTTGVVSYKTGFTNAAAVSGIMFSLVLLFDVVLGMMPRLGGAIPYFPSILMAILFISLLAREISR